MSKEKYIIESRPYNRPEVIERGMIEKGSGQSILSGETVKTLNRRADIGVPNWTEFWGVRLDSEGKILRDEKKNVILLDVKDPKYKGQVKELTWGDKDGCLIIGRYLKGYNTIDQQYQDVVLNAKDTIRDDTEASADAHYLRLQSGDNYYDPESDPYLCQMFRVHYMNDTSKYRSPDSQSSMFREKDETAVPTAQTKFMSEKFEALSIVNEASKDNTLQELRNLNAVMGAISNENAADNDLFRYLSMVADAKPDKFLAEIATRKLMVSQIFEKAKSWKVIDLTKDGVIAVGETTKEIIIDKVPAKGEAMLDWILANHLKENAFEAISRLKKITDNLK